MTVQTQSNEHELARAKTMRTISLIVAIVAFGVLVYGFGEVWKPWYQVPAGLAAWAAVEWQRRCYNRIKELSGPGSA